MELLRADFRIDNKQGVFTEDEIEMIDASVNGFKLPSDSGNLKLPIMKKVGVKSWPRAIAIMFKLNVIQSLCLVMAVTMTTGAFVSSDSDQLRFRSQQSRYRVRTY